MMAILSRTVKKIKSYSFIDACRKIVYVLLRGVGNCIGLLRKLRFYFFTKCWVSNILGGVYFDSICNNMKLGKHATLYPHTVFEVAESAHLNVGENFTLSYGAVIACRHSITMGNFVMIGEYSSVRDTMHAQEYSAVPYSKQNDTSKEVIIGNNVWIGRGCIVLPGSIIEDGVIVGAHSLVKGVLRAHCIYAGTPLKLIRELGITNIEKHRINSGITEEQK